MLFSLCLCYAKYADGIISYTLYFTRRPPQTIKNHTISDTLLQHLEEYVTDDVLQTLDSLPVAANAEELKQSVRIAYELRNCILASQDCTKAEICAELTNLSQCEQVQKAQHLQNLLTVLQILVKDCVQDLAVINGNVLQRVAKVAVELQDDLALFVTVINQANIGNEIKQEPVRKLSSEYIKQEDKSTTAQELVASENEIAGKRQAIETMVPLMSVVLDEAITTEMEIQLIKNKKENMALGSEQSPFIKNIASAGDEIAQARDKTMADDQVAISGVEAAASQSEELVSCKTVDALVDTKNLIVYNELEEFSTAVGTETAHVQIANCEITNLAVASEVILFCVEGVISAQITVAGMLHIYTNNTLLIKLTLYYSKIKKYKNVLPAANG